MKYKVWSTDYKETEADAEEIEAGSPEEAAEAWAEEMDCSYSEYAIANGEDVDVCVRVGDRVLRYHVWGETIPTYCACEKKGAESVDVEPVHTVKPVRVLEEWTERKAKAKKQAQEWADERGVQSLI